MGSIQFGKRLWRAGVLASGLLVAVAPAQPETDQQSQDDLPQTAAPAEGGGRGRLREADPGLQAAAADENPEPIIIDRWTMAEDAPSTPALLLRVPEMGDVWQLNPRILTGRGPTQPEDAQALARLGVHTIISIDAEPPAAWMAAAAGIKVFHAPIRYGQTDVGEFLELFRALKFFNGPYYIFAGPGEELRALHAGIITASFEENLDGRRIKHLYKDTDISTNLLPWWLDATGFLTRATYREVNALPAEAPIAVEPEPLNVWMQRAGASFEVLREASEKNWKTPPHAAKYTTLEFEADAIARNFERWSKINPDADAGLRTDLQSAALHAQELQKSLADKNFTAARASWLSLARSCQQCHETRRDRP